MADVQIQNIDANTQVGQSPKSKYKITIKRDLCIGAASCVAIAANAFEMDQDNLVFFRDAEWDPDDIMLAAAQSCPVFAIIIEDLETGKQIFPDA